MRLIDWLSIIFWIPAILLKLVLALLGLFIVPLALATRYLSANPVYDETHWPTIFWLWGNDEEGCPKWWRDRDHPWYIRPWYRFWWFAIRNPANNFRFLFKDAPINQCRVITNWSFYDPMEAKQLQMKNQKSAYRFVRYGWKSGYRRVWLTGDDIYSEIWIGWKVGSEVAGVGITLQVRLDRSIGT